MNTNLIQISSARMKFKRTFKTIFFFCMLSFLYPGKLYASHAMGSDITYYYLGANQYQIRFSFYRDCTGIPVSVSTGDITITNTCGFPTQTVNLSLTPGSPNQISPVCPTALSTCNGGAFTGIEEYVYTGVITLAGSCSEWTLYHSESARNASILTIVGSGSDNLFVYSTINNTNGIVNNSPAFNNRPVPFACAQQQLCYNHGAYDTDGDSLSYELITPRTGPLFSDTVSYLAGYSATQPFNSIPSMTFNNHTGDFCAVPVNPEVTVLAVLVKEWRNGILIGSVERDIQVTVYTCANNLPYLSGINGTPVRTMNVCVNDPISFWVTSSDLDAANDTRITWDYGIPGAILNTSGGHRDSAFFEWTPTLADLNSINCFTAAVSDNACPYFGSNVYSYCINVSDCQLTALITGNVFQDLNANCTKDGNESGLSINGNQPWFVKAITGSSTFYYVPDTSGYYSFNVHPGSYAITVIPADSVYAQSCPAAGTGYTVIVVNPTDTINGNDFAFGGPVPCSQLYVSVSAQLFRPCMNNVVNVTYGNYGTADEMNASVIITLPSELFFTSSSVPAIPLSNNQYLFSLGQVNAGANGNFYITTSVSCSTSAIINATLCISADIAPGQICGAPFPLWDHSSISVAGECRNDSLICFNIVNNGAVANGDMQGNSNWRLYIDNVLMQQGTFQLTGQDFLNLCFPSTGQTFRLEADQRPGHPANSRPRASVERCGTNVSFSLNQILTAPLDNGLPYHHEYCAVVRNSYDPNDKAVIPAGIGPNKFISRDDLLQYTIRFQNTGNDTAFNIIVRDTVDIHLLDLSTLTQVESSHPYQFTIEGNGILTWRFNNILLPDSTVNEPGSHGYVRFSIRQKAYNNYGIQIQNSAAIQFDFNPYVLTNTVWNTVWDMNSLATNTLTLTLNRQPNLCSGDMISLSAKFLGGYNYQWFKDGAIVSGANSISYTTGSQGNYYVRAISTFDTLYSSSVLVNVFTTPVQPSTISGLASILQGQQGVVYSIVPVSGASGYSWHVPVDAIIVSGQGTNSVTVNFGVQSGIVEVASVNPCGNSAYQNMTVTATPVGIQSVNYDNHILIYPNPADKQLFLKSDRADKIIVSLYTYQGKLVANLFDGFLIGNDSKIIPMEKFSNGFYILRISSEHFVSQHSVIVLH